LYWLRDRSQSNVDNRDNVSPEASGHFRNKKNEYLKAEIEEFETNSKFKYISDLYRGISAFMKGFQPSANVVLFEKGDLITDSRSILARWRNYFSHPFYVHGASNVKAYKNTYSTPAGASAEHI
jgi:hypothetical protein